MSEDRPLTPDETARVVELAMHFAREGMTDELAGFVEHGLPADVQDEDGNTPLMLAAYHGHAGDGAHARGARRRRRPAQQPRPVAGRRGDLQGRGRGRPGPPRRPAPTSTPAPRRPAQTAEMFERTDLLT